MKTETETQHFTKTDLLDRGWTETVIAQLLLHPDQTKTNPHYRSGPPMKLYSVDRVLENETSELFRAAQDKLAERKAAAQRAAETKRKQTMDFASEVKIKVPMLSESRLKTKACRHYDELRQQSGNDGSYADESDPNFLNRLCVNFIRHELTGYHHHLAKIQSKVGTADAYVTIKRRILVAIAEQYPWLAEECQRQSKQIDEASLSQLS